jgi:hypothetical protein
MHGFRVHYNSPFRRLTTSCTLSHLSISEKIHQQRISMFRHYRKWHPPLRTPAQVLLAEEFNEDICLITAPATYNALEELLIEVAGGKNLTLQSLKFGDYRPDDLYHVVLTKANMTDKYDTPNIDELHDVAKEVVFRMKSHEVLHPFRDIIQVRIKNYLYHFSLFPFSSKLSISSPGAADDIVDDRDFVSFKVTLSDYKWFSYIRFLFFCRDLKLLLH